MSEGGVDDLAKERGFTSWAAMNTHYARYGEGTKPDVTDAPEKPWWVQRNRMEEPTTADPSDNPQTGGTHTETPIQSNDYRRESAVPFTLEGPLPPVGIYTLPMGGWRVVHADGQLQDFDPIHYDLDYLQRGYRNRQPPCTFQGPFPSRS